MGAGHWNKQRVGAGDVVQQAECLPSMCRVPAPLIQARWLINPALEKGRETDQKFNIILGYSEFEASLGSTKLCLKSKTPRRNEKKTHTKQVVQCPEHLGKSMRGV